MPVAGMLPTTVDGEFPLHHPHTPHKKSEAKSQIFSLSHGPGSAEIRGKPKKMHTLRHVLHLHKIVLLGYTLSLQHGAVTSLLMVCKNDSTSMLQYFCFDKGQT